MIVGADINIGDKYGQTILHAISRDWHKDIARFVISCGGNINVVDDFGRTPLHVAAAVNYPEMIEFLVKSGGMLSKILTFKLPNIAILQMLLKNEGGKFEH